MFTARKAHLHIKPPNYTYLFKYDNTNHYYMASLGGKIVSNTSGILASTQPKRHRYAAYLILRQRSVQSLNISHADQNPSFFLLHRPALTTAPCPPNPPLCLPVTNCRICATALAFFDLRPSPTAIYSWNHCSSSPVSGRLTSSLPRAPEPCGCSSTEATSFSNSWRRVAEGWVREK